MILNTVDCTRPNNGRLPHGVDLMMSDFAGGASGFPMTFHGGKYTGNLLTQQELYTKTVISLANKRVSTMFNHFERNNAQCQHVPVSSLELFFQFFPFDRELEGGFHQEREEEAVELQGAAGEISAAKDLLSVCWIFH